MAKGKAAPSELVKVQFTITRMQMVALRREALERQARGEPGRADSSAVLRDVLDHWTKTQR